MSSVENRAKNVSLDTPRVSVVVPIFNTQEYLPACLESLAAQTMEAFEVILVDDGSNDASPAIVDRWASKDTRFKAVHRTNGGLSAARNTGLDMAQGTYLAFLDSDDLYEPFALDRLYSYAEEHELDVLDFTGVSFFDPKSTPAQNEGFEHRSSIEGIFSGPELFCRYQQLKEYYCSACFHLVRTNLLKEHGLRFREGIIHEDELFTPLLHAVATRAAFINEGLYLRRVRADSIITKPRGTHNVASLFTITQELHAWLVDNASKYPPAFVDAFSQRIFELRDIMGHDAYLWCTEAELDTLAETIAPNQRTDFEIYVRQNRNGIEDIYHEVESSTTYRVGNALLAFPRKLMRKIAP